MSPSGFWRMRVFADMVEEHGGPFGGPGGSESARGHMFPRVSDRRAGYGVLKRQSRFEATGVFEAPLPGMCGARILGTCLPDSVIRRGWRLAGSVVPQAPIPGHGGGF